MFSFFGKTEQGDEEKKGRARLWMILLGAAVGVMLLLFGSNTKSREEEPQKEIYSPEEDELVLYQNYLETRIKSLCESVNGVSGVTVIVTLSGSFESVYATEMKDGDEEYVIVGSGANASALFLSRQAPVITGVGIVCKGGDNATVRRELTSLICATLHVSSNRVYIADSGA